GIIRRSRSWVDAGRLEADRPLVAACSCERPPEDEGRREGGSRSHSDGCDETHSCSNRTESGSMAKKQNQPQRSKNPTRKWQPLKRAYYPKAAIEQVRREYGGAAAERLQKAQVYQNDRYEVAVHRTPPGAGAP